MVGLGVQNLPRPESGYRPSRDTRRADGAIKFESAADCVDEDARRAELIRWSIAARPSEIDRDRASRLASHLEDQSPDFICGTLASSLYMRDLRELIVGNLWPLVEDEGLGAASVATVRPTKMWVPASRLAGTVPGVLMNRLRGDLGRAGVLDADGYLIAGLHAEFDIRREGTTSTTI